MGKNLFWAISVLFILSSCTQEIAPEKPDDYIKKSLLNSAWKSNGVSPDVWYFKETVIESASNSTALAIASGDWLHPRVVRFEITQNHLVGWRPHASSLGAEGELEASVLANYRGAPVVAYRIVEHFDVGDEDKTHKIYDRPWFEREYVRIDWAKDALSDLVREDAHEGISTSRMTNDVTQLVDASFMGDPKRMRVGDGYLEFVTRHPIEVSEDAVSGDYGLPYQGDKAAPVIDVRHVFLKKKLSDFVPLPYPDQVSSDDGTKTIAINERFGFFRTGFDGQAVFDKTRGTSKAKVAHATIFNIWEKSQDHGHAIPLAERVPKPIIYYSSVTHPRRLLPASMRVAHEWDMALRQVVLKATNGRYHSINDVPAMWILRRNSCNEEEVAEWLDRKVPDLRLVIEHEARTSLKYVLDTLEEATALELTSYDTSSSVENNALRHLEQICTVLEYVTKNLKQPFVYQRLGDMRFNLINLESNNNQTSWSGYGPMIADPITGESISATANVNLSYLQSRAFKVATSIALIKAKSPGLMAVFGSGVNAHQPAASRDASIAMSHHMASMHHEDMSLGNALGALALVGKDALVVRQAVAELTKHRLPLDTATLALAGIKEPHPKPGHRETGKEELMDPVAMIDDIAIGVALRMKDLAPSELFIKILEMIYEAVLQHELGHNLGLLHNMSATADALNYGANFWRSSSLPENIDEAIRTVSDNGTKEILRSCQQHIRELAANAPLVLNNHQVTAQDCLQQSTGMYSSVMDYHASAFADTSGLGLYDKAAIMFAYGHVVESFKEANVVADADKTDIKKWLMLNDHRDIPKSLLKNVTAINDREYYHVAWDSERMQSSFPKNAVPYSFCSDHTGREGPRCLAFDFGPDMRSQATWLKSRFYNNYVLSQFAQNETWGSADVSRVVASEIDVLNRFTLMLRWYSKLKSSMPEFSGSYRERDYLAALAIGLNHFAHVIGMPESGAYLSAPHWKMNDGQTIIDGRSRLLPSTTMIPFNKFESCEASSLTKITDKEEVHARGDYHYVEVPLGMGRPYNDGYDDDGEHSVVLYAGSSIIKRHALLDLLLPMSLPKTASTVEKRDIAAMSWHTMFPKVVEKILKSVIAREYQHLGPVLLDDGTLTMRDVIDQKTLKPAQPSEGQHLMPAVSESLRELALKASFATLVGNKRSPFFESLRIQRAGSPSEWLVDGSNADVTKLTTLNGDTYYARSVDASSSVSTALLKSANVLKEKYVRLNACVDSESVRNADSLCQCIKTSDRKSFSDWECCDEDNERCPGPTIEAFGEGLCGMEQLRERRDKSLDELNAAVGFIDQVRNLMKRVD